MFFDQFMNSFHLHGITRNSSCNCFTFSTNSHTSDIKLIDLDPSFDQFFKYQWGFCNYDHPLSIKGWGFF